MTTLITAAKETTIATALRGFKALGHSVTLTFLFRNKFYFYIMIYQLSKNEPKLNVRS